MKKNIIALAAVAAMLSGTACTKMLDLTPKDSISDKVMWAQVSSAEYAVNSIYSYVYDIYAAYPCVAGMTEALTDQFKYGSYLYNSLCFIPSEIAYGGNTLTANYVDVYLGAWDSLYGAVRRTNEAIYNLHTLGTGLPEADRIRLEAELRLMRSWLYFELVKRYRDVILYDEDMSAISTDKALSDEADVWTFIKGDLVYAETNLPVKEQAKGRLNKGVAYALASRALLYAHDWEGVIAAADNVKEQGYDLEANYAGVFKAEGKETILSYNFSYADNITHSYDFYYTPGGDYSLSTNRVAAMVLPHRRWWKAMNWLPAVFLTGHPGMAPPLIRLRMLSLSLVSRPPYFITGLRGKAAPSSPGSAEPTDGPSGARRPSRRAAPLPDIICARALMRAMTSLPGPRVSSRSLSCVTARCS